MTTFFLLLSLFAASNNFKTTSPVMPVSPNHFRTSTGDPAQAPQQYRGTDRPTAFHKNP
jgi:hypothetical protein